MRVAEICCFFSRFWPHVRRSRIENRREKSEIKTTFWSTSFSQSCDELESLAPSEFLQRQSARTSETETVFTYVIPNSGGYCVLYQNKYLSHRRRGPALRSQQCWPTNWTYRFHGRSVTANSVGSPGCRRSLRRIEFRLCKPSQNLLELGRRNIPLDWPEENLAKQNRSLIG